MRLPKQQNANIMLGSTSTGSVTGLRPCTSYGVLLIDYITNGRDSMALYMITDYEAPIDSSNRVRTEALTAEQVAAVYEYNRQARRVYGQARFELEAIETNKALKA